MQTYDFILILLVLDYAQLNSLRALRINFFTISKSTLRKQNTYF